MEPSAQRSGGHGPSLHLSVGIIGLWEAFPCYILSTTEETDFTRDTSAFPATAEVIHEEEQDRLQLASRHQQVSLPGDLIEVLTHCETASVAQAGLKPPVLVRMTLNS